MRVDFYQLSETPVEGALPALAAKMREAGAKVLVVSADDAQLGRISEALWAPKGSFLAHGAAGGPDDARQPILLSDRLDAPNSASFLAIDPLAPPTSFSIWLSNEVALASNSCRSVLLP